MWVVSAALRFFFTPGGKVLLAVLAFVAWTAYQRADATSDCADTQVRVELEEAIRRLGEAERIAQAARDRANKSAVELEQMGTERDAILSELEARGQSCAIPPDLAERLRRIR